ncbi:acyl-CoA reductase [Magnetospirillum gryphiswaldense]|uniref:long-chain-fatty-acyl-CoA reductase n=1 Tax=Magnetospirillum gryphiswaldense TaxID=55518 RepID=A4U5Q1_9PROT|nr:acyl-CoA reductase [Magnetospirillum gryphiswaldense]AVM73025.1 Acyl-CoA reductase (LuxC) [Magnetospirillum gryphiswaldense MSR-1]AVM76928.1 Acyl-CoA reductase (LuxC) [Magnetospirillum gryphiswaldense]CAM78208.1 conserved hypothetical protein [Magnetospirillum gryphiswaldense MSR-1]
MIRGIGPSGAVIDINAAITALAKSDNPGLPFATEAVAALATLSDRLLMSQSARHFPELVALGFWLRRTHLNVLAAEFARTRPAQAMAVPRGLVLHIPPANVDVMMAYPWALSLLAGNRNIIRVSSRIGAAGQELLDAMTTILAESPVLAASNLFVSWPRDHTHSLAELSALADFRLVWGGDATIAQIRAVPLPPHAGELCFADRASLCAMAAEAVNRADEEELRHLAERFAADITTFGQAACSSPRLLVWVGDDAACERAQQRLVAALDHLPDMAPLAPAIALGRNAYVHRAAAEGLVSRPATPAGPILFAHAPKPVDGQQWGHCFGGLVHVARGPSLATVASFIQRRHQTLCHFGFDPAELAALVTQLRGTGLDRLVPVGTALRFSHLWDGVDLLERLTKSVHLLAP